MSDRVTAWPDGLRGQPVRLRAGTAWTDGWPEEGHQGRSRVVEETSGERDHRRIFRITRPDDVRVVRAVTGIPGEAAVTSAQVAVEHALDMLAIADHLTSSEGHLAPMVEALMDTLSVAIRDPVKRRVLAESTARSKDPTRQDTA